MRVNGTMKGRATRVYQTMRVRATRVYDIMRGGHKGLWHHEGEMHDGL